MNGLPALPSDLPSIAQAKLPMSYAKAKLALTECTRIDECQEWADKAEVLASYAKQAQDEELRRMADRIQARAIRRCGELLSQIRSAAGRPTPEIKDGTDHNYGRTSAARDAGLSERQQKTAIRVSRISDAEFETAVEAEEPPTVTALADKGRMPRTNHLNGRDPNDFRAATALLGLLHHIVRTSENIDAEAAARGLNGREFDDALSSLAIAKDWIAFVANELRS